MLIIDLICGDCLKEIKNIPDNYVDLILTDPPYEISRKTNFKNGEPNGLDTDRFRITMDFGEWDKQKVDFYEILKECRRVLKDNGTIIWFCDLYKITIFKNYFDKLKFNQVRFIEWVKTNPVPINSKINYLTNSREVALTAVKKNKPIFNSEYDNGIYNYPICHNKDRFHPTQKPVELFKDLILKHTNKNNIVLDPFAGSFTTGVACIETNRDFIGIELDNEYFEKGKNRIEKAKEVIL